MKLSLDKSKISLSFSDAPAVPSYSFYEYQWDGPRRHHVPVWQPRQTTLLVVFDGQSRHLFSTAHILLYYVNGSPKDAQAGNVWDIEQSGPVIHALRGRVRHPRSNAPTLPRLTVAFEVAVGQVSSKSSAGILVLRSPSSTQELRRSAISVLLECESVLTSDTLSLTLSFTHSTMLCTPITSNGRGQHSVLKHPASRIEFVTTRIVRVLPLASSRPRIADGCLPAELLIKTFKDTEFYHTWPSDLLSFAQVCRAWSCAMDVFHSRVHFSDNDRRIRSRPRLDVYAFAKALCEKPLLARGFSHLTTDNFGDRSEDEQDDAGNDYDNRDDISRRRSLARKRKDPARCTTALLSILGRTRNVQRVHLGQLDPAQANMLFTVLHELGRNLRTLSIGPIAEERPPTTGLRAHTHGPRLLSVVQLARCMARWPALTTLKVHHLHPGLVPGLWRFALRVPPACTLTQLTLRRSHVADRDLVHLFAASTAARTLEHVVLDHVVGITNTGLTAFLRAVAPSVVRLTVRDVGRPPPHERGSLILRTERALDAVIDKMLRLCELRIGGDVASEFMLDRRSRAFVVAHGEGTWVPVVRLWVEDVPRLCGFAADRRWPGWCTPGRMPLRR